MQQGILKALMVCAGTMFLCSAAQEATNTKLAYEPTNNDLSFRKTLQSGQATFNKKAMGNLIKLLQAKVATLATDVTSLFNQLKTFRQKYKLETTITITDLQTKSSELARAWDSDNEEKYDMNNNTNTPINLPSKQIQWWHAWKDLLGDVSGINIFMNMFKKNYASRDALKSELNNIYQTMMRARDKAINNHAFIGLIIEKMNQASTPAIVDAINNFKRKLQNMSYSIAKERGIKVANDDLLDEYTTSTQYQVTMLLKIALDFFESIHLFNRTLESFWAEIERTLTQETIEF
jgi:hypothetical protein